MTAIAEKLDEVMKRLPAAAATSVEKLVGDVIEVVECSPLAETEREARIRAHQAHISRCLDEASALDWSDFERPPQGEYEVREAW